MNSYQKPGRRAAGWIWSLPDQVSSDAQPVAPDQATSDPEPAAQLSNNPVRESQETRVSPKSKPISDEEWVIAVKFFQDLGVWADDLGPPPGHSGCRAPLDLLECFGFAKVGRRSA